MKNLQKLLMSLTLSICILSCFELFAWSQLQDDIYTGDSGYFWKLKPNLNRTISNGSHPFTLQTNSVGFRDEELEDGERWLFIGCSTTLGWGVDYTEGFVRQLDLHFENVDIVNGGQPGWSTQQVLYNIEQFKSLSPTKVFVGLGVRDAQVSVRPDKDARPSSWIANLHLFRWLQYLKTQSKTQAETTVDAPNISTNVPPSHRVSPEDFLVSLQTIQQSFPQSEVVFYEFPQLKFSSEHSAVLTQMEAWKPGSFDQRDFFSDDPIHLTINGHQKLKDWFIERLSVADLE